MLLGVIGMGIGFYQAPKDIAQVEEILKNQEGEHGSSHGEVGTHGSAKPDSNHSNTEHDVTAGHANEAHAVIKSESEVTRTVAMSETIAVDTLSSNAVVKVQNVVYNIRPTPKVDEHAEHEKHLVHVLHQLQNKPWAALYVACLFMMLISLGVLAFYAIQQVAQAEIGRAHV